MYGTIGVPRTVTVSLFLSVLLALFLALTLAAFYSYRSFGWRMYKRFGANTGMRKLYLQVAFCFCPSAEAHPLAPSTAASRRFPRPLRAP